MLTVRRDDTVKVISGRDKGKKGKVLRVVQASDRILVQGIHFVKKAMRPSKDNPQGGIHQVETTVHISNVMVVCPQCNKPSRVGRKRQKDGKLARICKKCKGEV
jgi:large subunit ribosomal protein L24